MTNTLTLTRSQAAALCGLTTSGFDTWVRRGIVPPAMAGTRRWSRAAIEQALGGKPETAIDPYERQKAERASK